MHMELSTREFRRLLDLVYIGNWILNSTRGRDRITQYDQVESKVFGHCRELGMDSLYEVVKGEVLPSRAFSEGGIHEAIMDYEDAIFYEILAEELARRDMHMEAADQNDSEELNERIEEYIEEFEQNGIDNITLN